MVEIENRVIVVVREMVLRKLLNWRGVCVIVLKVKSVKKTLKFDAIIKI